MTLVKVTNFGPLLFLNQIFILSFQYLWISTSSDADWIEKAHWEFFEHVTSVLWNLSFFPFALDAKKEPVQNSLTKKFIPDSIFVFC